ncbi:MAG: phytoene/squalene synthase family protein [Pseudomonadota bacterium]
MQKNIFKDNSKTFSFAALFLDEQTQNNITIFYNFCRTIDNIADDAQDYQIAKQDLLSIQSDIKNGSSEIKIIQDFISLSQTLQIDQKYIFDLLDGVISDCENQVIIKDQDHLDLYCYQVAGAVGAIMCFILKINPDQREYALPYAIQMGQAMQMTNIARDILEDAQNNRVYLPASWLNENDIQTLLSAPHTQNENIQQACQKLLARADDFYKSARQGLYFLTIRQRFCIFVASHLYAAIGLKIKYARYEYWQGRQFLSLSQKLLRTLYLFVVFPFQSFMWRAP